MDGRWVTTLCSSLRLRTCLVSSHRRAQGRWNAWAHGSTNNSPITSSKQMAQHVTLDDGVSRVRGRFRSGERSCRSHSWASASLSKKKGALCWADRCRKAVKKHGRQALSSTCA
jgi:hypothetical protein